MIKHTLEISQRPARLSLRQSQLVIHFGDGEGETRQFACEDIGVIVLQHPAISLSAAILNALLEAGAAVVICNEKHLPSGILLPTTTHTELVPRMMAQLEAGLPARKNAWKAIVQAKISAQARELPPPQRNKLFAIAQSVKSGDPENAEARAAKIYWPARFPQIYQNGDQRDFDSASLFNVLLNYGYAILRAAVARAIVASGLQPALGVFHHRRNNPYCLADDIMEPLRPLVDRTASRILEASPNSSTTTLLPEYRRAFLALLSENVDFQEQSGPLMAVLPRYINDFYRLLTRENEHLNFPTY